MPTAPPLAPAPVSQRPSLTLAQRRISLTVAAQLAAYLQTDARDGDDVTLPPGVNLGNFTLPATARAGWVKITCPGCVATGLTAASGAQGYAIRGLAVGRPPVGDGQTVYDLVNLEPGSRRIALSDLRITGTPAGQTRRGVSLNGADQSLTQSTIDEIHVTGQDSQGINGLHGPGPFLIEDVAITCGTEGIMFGGGDPTTKDLVPADITLRRVKLSKSATMLSGPWVRKNLLEFKNAQRWLVEDSDLFDYPGVAIVLTPRNQGGTAPWCTVRDGLIRYCRFQNVATVVSGQVTDDIKPSALAGRLAFRNLLAHCTDVFLAWGAGVAGASMDDLEVSHCTSLPHSRAAFMISTAFRRLTVRDNLLGFGAYSQQWTPQITGEDSDVRQNYLVNLGGGDGQGAVRNRTDGTRFLACNPADIKLNAATGLLDVASPLAHAATDGTAIGYVPAPGEAAPVPVDPLPDLGGNKLIETVQDHETRLRALEQWRKS